MSVFLNKFFVLSSFGVVAGGIASLFGGLDDLIIALLIFMLIDFTLGLLVGAVFKNSPKTEDGRLESYAAWKGLIRKFSVLLLILIAVQLDILLGVDYIRNMVIFAFLADELLSIIENIGLTGVPIPAVVRNAISALSNKGEVKDETK